MIIHTTHYHTIECTLSNYYLKYVPTQESMGFQRQSRFLLEHTHTHTQTHISSESPEMKY